MARLYWISNIRYLPETEVRILCLPIAVAYNVNPLGTVYYLLPSPVILIKSSTNNELVMFPPLYHYKLLIPMAFY